MSFSDFDENSKRESRDMWDVWSNRLLETFNEAIYALGKEAACHMLLQIALQELRRLEPLVEAGWRGDEPKPGEHFEAIRHLSLEIVKAGMMLPPSGTEPEPDELKGG